MKKLDEKQLEAVKSLAMAIVMMTESHQMVKKYEHRGKPVFNAQDQIAMRIFEKLGYFDADVESIVDIGRQTARHNMGIPLHRHIG